MGRHPNFDLLIAIMGVPHYMRRQAGMTAEAYLERYRIKSANHKPLLAVVPDKSLGTDNYEDPDNKLLSALRTRLIAANIPAYPTMERAAAAVKKLTDYYLNRPASSSSYPP
jgi:hypothetical protein